MPHVSDQYGSLMKHVILRCWSQDPELRPSFDDIFVEFRSHGFHLFPGVDSTEITNYVHGIEGWESITNNFDDFDDNSSICTNEMQA
jgi:hypothetical protein